MNLYWFGTAKVCLNVERASIMINLINETMRTQTDKGGRFNKEIENYILEDTDEGSLINQRR